MKGYITVDDGCVQTKKPVKPIVSVIVPVYNVERYLDQALTSIEEQTLESLEILCVNDGSTDGSRDIMQAHADKDNRIRIIDKPNGGYGAACNRGIAEAKGEWIAILEPDDWIEPGMFRDMISFAATLPETIDIIKTPYWRIWLPDTPEQMKLNCSFKGRIKPASQPFEITDPGATHMLCHHPSIWSALYRREFLESHDIRFHEFPGAGWADNPFLIDTLCQAKSIAYLDKPYYNYREDTPEKLTAFAQRSTFLPIERWHNMADDLERLGITDENIWRAHYSRGFTYISGIIEEVDLTHDDVREAVLGVFNRMDDNLVFTDSELSPAWKRKYAELKGLEMPNISPVPYALGLVKAGLYFLGNTNLKYTAYATSNFIKKFTRRQGGR